MMKIYRNSTTTNRRPNLDTVSSCGGDFTDVTIHYNFKLVSDLGRVVEEKKILDLLIPTK